MSNIAAFMQALDRAVARRTNKPQQQPLQQQTKIATPTISAKPLAQAPVVATSSEDRHRAAVLDCFYRHYMDKQKEKNDD
ncbi:hypothetical protein [Pseudomonas sp. Kh13]|uniref:hypothetical protein n=1 Tax=Pseudomonas sp. Kh13 TaxID=2093744 RepID=UPI0011838ADB|nr:hypothetical protein [Pseudomonas sp. Kh13]